MAAADIAQTTARANFILQTRSDGAVFNNTVGDENFLQDEFLRAAIETESEIVRVLADSEHPERIPFLAWSSDLNHGDNLPVHIGRVEAVQIKPYSAAGTYDPAEETTRENILQWRENHNNIFDPTDHDVTGSNLAGFFALTKQTILFTGNVAQVKVCTFDPDFGTPAHQLDEKFEDGIVCGMIPKLYKDGVPAGVVNHYSSMFGQFKAQLANEIKAVPEINMAQKIED